MTNESGKVEAPAPIRSDDPDAFRDDRDRDFFTDAVPLRDDREARAREERIRRLDEARPRHRRTPRTVVGAAVVLVALLGVAGLAVLGRSSGRRSVEPRPKNRREASGLAPIKTADPTPTIGLATAVPVAGGRPRRPMPEAHHVNHRKSPGSGPGSAHLVPAEVPEVADPEVEAETETDGSSEPETRPVQESPPPPAAESGPDRQPEASVAEGEAKTSSSSEADRQFGFGR